MSLQGLAASVTGFGFHVPMPAFAHVFAGFQFLGVILVTAIPFGIYDLVEAIDNVESAAVAGDSFPDNSCPHRRWCGQPDRLHDGQSFH
jgi:AGZA family xanthine/uracil permease-like MFS transporter